MLSKTEHRLALVILVTALLPLASAMVLAYSLLHYASSVWLRPEVEQQLDRGIDLYKDYIRAIKDGMKHQTDALAADQDLRDAAVRGDAAACRGLLASMLARQPQIVSLEVEEPGGRVLAERDRGRPLDDATERKLEVSRPLFAARDGSRGLSLAATFAFDRRYELELVRAGAVHDAYAQLESKRTKVYSGYLEAFALLLGTTVVATVLLGFVLARGITRRIGRLAKAIEEVAAGNLEIRVAVTGSDELTELARVFNRMLGEMQQSRARIEYLQRIGAWQEMAQRLAHEIKNPLTPIQLAVQECHRKYGGEDPRFRVLLNTTLEIVEEEVGTLRRLVGTFSSFARLPHAELREASLRDFIRECSDQLLHLGAQAEGVGDGPEGAEDGIAAPDVDVRWEVPDDAMPVAIDRQMLRRVLVNLVRNAVDAARTAHPQTSSGPRGHVRVSAEMRGEQRAILVEDDGCGVPEGARDRVFDPYFTTKATGTGLGLAIVKKIVVEHRGTIATERSVRLGGAAFVVSLPPPRSVATSPSVAERQDEEPANAAPARRASAG